MARFSRAETFDPSEIVSGHTIARTARLCYLLGNDQHASTAPGRWRATIHRNPKPGNHQERRPLKIRDPTLPYLTLRTFLIMIIDRSGPSCLSRSREGSVRAR